MQVFAPPDPEVPHRRALRRRRAPADGAERLALGRSVRWCCDAKRRADPCSLLPRRSPKEPGRRLWQRRQLVGLHRCSLARDLKQNVSLVRLSAGFALRSGKTSPSYRAASAPAWSARRLSPCSTNSATSTSTWVALADSVWLVGAPTRSALVRSLRNASPRESDPVSRPAPVAGASSASPLRRGGC